MKHYDARLRRPSLSEMPETLRPQPDSRGALSGYAEAAPGLR